MNELALYSGAGGGILGSVLLGHRVVAAVEKEPYCREVLLRRQRDGMLPLFPIWDDARTFDGRPFRGCVDIVTAGFPCQPFSAAGRRRAEDDERNMWPDTIRIIREVGPRFAFLENVTGLLGGHGYFGQVLGDLAESGFDAEWDCLPASTCGAPHQRDRVWILAHAIGDLLRDQPGGRGGESWAGAAKPRDDGAEKPLANTQSGECLSHLANSSELAERKSPKEAVAEPARRQAWAEPGRRGWWDVEPELGRVADGVAHRMDRFAALGNGQVPIVAATAFRMLMERVEGNS